MLLLPLRLCVSMLPTTGMSCGELDNEDEDIEDIEGVGEVTSSHAPALEAPALEACLSPSE